MIICADLNMVNYGHVPFNTAMLKMICKIYPNDKILFYSEKRNIDHIKESVEKANLQYKERSFVSEGRRMQVFVKEFVEIYNLCKIINFYKQNNAKVLIVFSVFPLTHFILKFIKLLDCKLKIIVVLHGELENIKETERINFRFWGWILEKTLKIRSGIKYIVLGEVIKEVLPNYVKVKDDLYWIDHPYSYQEIETYSTKLFPLKIGTIGFANKKKKTHLIFKLGSDLNKYIKGGMLQLFVIGKINHDIHEYINNTVKYAYSSEILTQEDFSTQIQQIDYALFFYDDDAYKICASGVFFDALKFEKPIITIKNNFFCYYFKKYGNIGYMCDDYQEVMSKVEYILKNKPLDEYSEQVENLRLIKKDLGLLIIQDKLKEIIEK